MHPLKLRHLTPALCAIALFGDLPGERVLREGEGEAGGGGGGGGSPPIPTVTGEPRRPVELGAGAAQPPDPPAAAPSEITEDVRLARALGLIGPTAPAAPAATPPTAPAAAPPAAPATPPPGAPPPAPPASPGAAPEADPRQSGGAEFAAALERVTAREREIDERARTVAEREAAHQRYSEFETRLREKDVLGAISSLGYSFDDLTRAAVENRGVEKPSSKLEKDVETLRAELTTLRQEREAAQRAETLAQVHREIDASITAHSPLLATLGTRARDAVWEHIASTYQSTGGRVTLSYQEAIAAVDRDFSAIVTQALAVESVREKLLPKPAPGQAPSGISDPAAIVTPGRPPTLTNADASTPARRAESDVMSEDERLARALRHLE